MRAVVQRVRRARVVVAGAVAGEIGAGSCALIGIAHDDDERDADSLALKLAGLRIFPDAHGAMNRSLAESGGAILVISQFTLLGNVRQGRRPSLRDR